MVVRCVGNKAYQEISPLRFVGMLTGSAVSISSLTLLRNQKITRAIRTKGCYYVYPRQLDLFVIL
jgi:hypothetical protein